MRYVTGFDVECLIETFTDATFPMSSHFVDHVKYLAQAMKLSHQGRKSEGGLSMCKRTIAKFIDLVDSSHDHMPVLKFSKLLFGGDEDVLCMPVYVPPSGSPFYRTTKSSCHLNEVEICLRDAIEICNYCDLSICGDLHSRKADCQTETQNVFYILDEDVNSNKVAST